MQNVTPSDFSVEQPSNRFLGLVRSTVLEEETPPSTLWLAVRRSVGRPVMHTYLNLWVLLSPRRRMHGFLVALLEDWKNPDAQFSKIHEALRLISETDHSRLVRIRRDIGRIVVMQPMEGTAAAFMKGTSTCFLSPDLLRDSSVLRLAQTVVHEAMHARLGRLRPRLAYTPRNRARAEGLAVRAEIAFTRKVSGEAAASRLNLLCQLYSAYRLVAQEIDAAPPAA
jgi:hypothetical protein